MGVWLGPRGKRALVIDLASLTAKGDKWNGTDGVDALAPTITPEASTVSIAKTWYPSGGGYGNDKAGIAVSGALDLTDYSKIIVDVSAVSGVGHVAVYVSTSNTDFSRSRDLVNLYDQPAGTLELNVSGLTGTYYFGIAIEATGQASNTKTITISSIKATK